MEGSALLKRNHFYFAFLLVLVIIVAILGFLVIQRGIAPSPSDPTSPPDTTAAPTPGGNPGAVPGETPEETPSVPPTEPPVFETRPPIESPEPTEEPEETPEPTDVPAIPGAAGSFTSNTGTGLNLLVEWTTVPQADGSATLLVDISAVSYSFFTSALYQSLSLNLNGEVYTANSAEVSYNGTEQISTQLASFTLDAPASGTPISVTWAYRGSYSNKQLDEIIASGVIVY